MHIYFFLHKTLGCHEAGLAVAVGIVGCHNDNLRCRQYRHSWHCGSSRFLVFMHLFKCFYVSNQMVCEISLHSVPSLSPHFAIYFSKQPRKDTPWLTCKGEVWEVFNWLIVWSELWFVPPAFVRYWGDRLWYDASLQYLHQQNDIFVYLWCDALFLPYYLHDVTCVKFILEFACFQGRKLSRNQLCCQLRHRRTNDNFRWRHWQLSWHYDSSRFSTCYAISLYNVLSRDHTEKTPRGSPVRARYGLSFEDSWYELCFGFLIMWYFLYHGIFNLFGLYSTAIQ